MGNGIHYSKMRAVRVRILVTGLLSAVAFLFGAAQSVWAVSVSTTKPIIRETVPRGGVVQGSIELTNQGKHPVKVTVYLEDWRYVPEGGGDKEFVPPGTLPRSCATWINYFPTDIEVPAYGRGVVDYTIRVPQDSAASGGYQAVLFFESTIATAASPDQAGVSVRYAARLGSLFFVEVEGTVVRQASLENLMVTPPGSSGILTIAGSLANQGNVPLKCTGTFHLMDSTGLIAGRGELPLQYLSSESEVPVQTQWAGSLAPGSYTAILTYDCEEGLIVVEEVPLTVP